MLTLFLMMSCLKWFQSRESSTTWRLQTLVTGDTWDMVLVTSRISENTIMVSTTHDIITTTALTI